MADAPLRSKFTLELRDPLEDILEKSSRWVSARRDAPPEHWIYAPAGSRFVPTP